MKRTVRVDGAAFEHEEYVEYSEAKINAGVVATLAVLLGAFGFYFIPRVPDGIGYATAYLGGFAIVYWWLLRTAKAEWDRARGKRLWAEARLKSAGMLGAVMASVVIGTLEKIAGREEDA